MSSPQASSVVVTTSAPESPASGLRTAHRVLWYDSDALVVRQQGDECLESFHVTLVRDPGQLLRACGERAWDVVVVCSAVSSANALGLIAQVRRGHDAVGIVLLTAAFDEVFISRALSSGADDFVSLADTGDFAPRLQVAARRRLLPTLERARFALGNGISLDLMEQTVCTARERVQIAGNGFRILACLARAGCEIVSPERLCEFAGIQRAPGHANLQTEVWRLRRTLAWLAPLVENVRGKGYRIRPDLVRFPTVFHSSTPA